MSKTFAFSSRKSLEIIILFLFFTIYFHHVHSSNRSSSNEEKSILLQLKEHWWWNSSSLDGWNASFDYCTWRGIKCSIEGSVEGIEVTFGDSITFGYIDQIIPPLICDLKNLISINLSSYSLTYSYRPFPTSLCNCSKLKSLALSGIHFDGGIPGNIDGLLSPHLEWLDLSAGYLIGGIPAAIGNFTSLQYLNLSQNGLTGGTTFMARFLLQLVVHQSFARCTCQEMISTVESHMKLGIYQASKGWTYRSTISQHPGRLQYSFCVRSFVSQQSATRVEFFGFSPCAPRSFAQIPLQLSTTESIY